MIEDAHADSIPPQATAEEVEAQRQWLETGTVPIDYVNSRCDRSMSTSDDPIHDLIESFVNASRGR